MKTGIVTFSTIIIGLLITAAIVATSSCIIGCGEEVVKGEEEPTEDPVVKPTDPTPPSQPQPEPEPELSDLDKARNLYNETNDEIEELIEKRPDKGADFKEVLKIYDRVYKKNMGVGHSFAREVLLKIYLEEKPDEAGKEYNTTALLLEYLRLSFKFPKQREEGLLKLFRKSVQEGRVSANKENPKPTLEPEEDED